jgi:hypothetical protein
VTTAALFGWRWLLFGFGRGVLHPSHNLVKHVRSVATNEVEDQPRLFSQFTRESTGVDYDGRQRVDMNPGSRKRRIANFLLVAWCVLQGSSEIQ